MPSYITEAGDSELSRPNTCFNKHIKANLPELSTTHPVDEQYHRISHLFEKKIDPKTGCSAAKLC